MYSVGGTQAASSGYAEFGGKRCSCTASPASLTAPTLALAVLASSQWERQPVGYWLTHRLVRDPLEAVHDLPVGEMCVDCLAVAAEWLERALRQALPHLQVLLMQGIIHAPEPHGLLLCCLNLHKAQ